MRAALLLPVVLTACWSMKTPQMKAASEMRDPIRAEEAWFAELGSDDLTRAEFDYGLRQACAVRVARIETELRTMDGIEAAEAAVLHEQLSVCEEAYPLQLQLASLEEVTASLALADLDRAGRPAHTTLVQAIQHVRRLQADSPWASWYTDARERRQAELVAQYNRETRPVMRGMIAQLASDLGQDLGPDLLAAGSDRLAVHLRGVEWRAEGECAAILADPGYSPPTTAGVPADIVVTLRGCSDAVSVTHDERHWEETHYRTEWENREVCTTVTAPSTTSYYHHQACWTEYRGGERYQVCNGASGPATTTTTAPVTTCAMENVEVEVPYTVPRSETLHRATRDVRGELVVSIRSADGQQTLTLPYARAFVGATSTTTAVPPSGEGSRREAAQEALGMVTSAGTTAASTLRRDALLRQAATQPEADARETLLVALAGGSELSSAQLDLVSLPFALEPSDVARWRTLPALPAFQPHIPIQRTIPWRPPRSGLAYRGFPPSLLSLGGRYTSMSPIPSQPDRTAGGALVRARAAGSIGQGEGSDGFGVHLMLDAGLEIGGRASEKWNFPRSDAEEFPLSLAFEVQGAGLLGYRSRAFGLYAGLAPMSARHIVGAQTSRGLAFPLMAYAELRIARRYPILATVWGSGIRTQRSSTYGVRVDLPVARDFWLSVRYEERTLRTFFHGLTPDDTIDAGYRALTLGGIDVTFSK